MDEVVASDVHSKSWLFIGVNDVFDELKTENQRLMNEILFANQLKTHLIKIHSKYETIISPEDKLEFNELLRTQEVVTNDTSIQDYYLNGLDLRKSPTKKPQKRLKRSQDVNPSDDGLNEAMDDKSSEIYDKNKKSVKMTKRSKTVKTIKTLKARELNGEKCFDLTTNSYICSQNDCHKSYKTYLQLLTHVQRVHSNDNYVCDYCNKGFKCQYYLKEHLKNHTTPKPFKCDYNGCQYECRVRRDLHKHMAMHSSEKPFICDVIGCGKTFKYQSSLLLHSRNHSTEPTVRCTVEGCRQLFFKPFAMHKHRISEHNFPRRVRPKEPIVPCDWPGCDYTGRSSKLVVHKRTHTGERPYACDWPECGKRFIKPEYLRDHKNIHNNLKPYACHWPGCQFRSSSYGNYWTHCKQSHK